MNTRRLALAMLLCGAAFGCRTPRDPLLKDPTPYPRTSIPDSALVLADSGEARVASRDRIITTPDVQQLDAKARELVVFFVISAWGRPGVSSVRFGLGVDRRTRAAACRAILSSTFAPVRRDGQPRPALVVLSWAAVVAGDAAAARAGVPSVEPFRRVVRREGIAAALDELASRPRC